jgi:flagellar FliJ protein
VKQPAFRLEPVLKLRRTEERAAALAAAQAAREAAAAAERAERDAAALTERALPAQVTGGAFIAAMVASAAAAADVSAARAVAVARAAQRTKGLERLRERHVAALQAAADAAEERVVDDLVTRQHSTTARSSREEMTWTD